LLRYSGAEDLTIDVSGASRLASPPHTTNMPQTVYCVYSEEATATVLVTGDEALTVVSEYADGDSCGVKVAGGLTVDGGSAFALNVQGANIGIDAAGPITLQNGAVLNTQGGSHGVYLRGDNARISVESGSGLNASAYRALYNTYGVYAEKSLTITGKNNGAVTASGFNNQYGGSSYGIYAGGTLTIDGAALSAPQEQQPPFVTALGGLAIYSYGIYAENVTVTGENAVVIASAGGVNRAAQSSGRFAGIVCAASDQQGIGKLTVNGACVEANGFVPGRSLTNAELERVSLNCGVTGAVEVTGGGSLTAHGGESNTVSAGIFYMGSAATPEGEYDLLCDDGTINARADSAHYVGESDASAYSSVGIALFSIDNSTGQSAYGRIKLGKGASVACAASDGYNVFALQPIDAENSDFHEVLVAYVGEEGSREKMTVDAFLAGNENGAYPRVLIEANTYAVSFDTDGGTPVETQTVVVGETAVRPENDPTRDGWDFGGWFGDVERTAEFDFDTYRVTCDTTVYAKWTEKPKEQEQNVSWTGYDPGPAAPIVAETEHGTVSYTPKRPGVGAAVTVTLTPEEGWEPDTITVTDAAGKPLTLTENEDGTYTFTQGSKQVTITATFKAIPDVLADFDDLDPDAWYADDVRWALKAGLMEGFGDGTFGPDKTVSRAMVMTVLWNLAGQPVVNYAMPFSDVAPDAWYAEAVRWAAAEHITEGYEDGTFRAGQPVTREELAVFFYRYAQTKGLGFTGAWMFPLDFDDASDISPWADEAVHWMVMQGVLNGRGDGVFAPGEKATRAELAAMLRRFDAILNA
jgi:uncharacterized repeat protein (TIGR02543 family)